MRFGLDKVISRVVGAVTVNFLEVIRKYPWICCGFIA